MKVYIQATIKEPESSLCGSMRRHEVGIITKTLPTSMVAVGSAVIRVSDEKIIFPQQVTWSCDLNSYRYRPLRPGEKVIFEGE